MQIQSVPRSKHFPFRL